MDRVVTCSDFVKEAETFLLENMETTLPLLGEGAADDEGAWRELSAQSRSVQNPGFFSELFRKGSAWLFRHRASIIFVILSAFINFCLALALRQVAF